MHQMPIWFLILVVAGMAFAAFRLRSGRGGEVHGITRVIAAIIIATAFVLLSLNIAGLYQFGGH
jgi:hypothetical protein